MSIPVRNPVFTLAGALAGLLVTASWSIAQTTEGMFVTVPNPITSDAVKQIEAQVAPRINTDTARRVTTVVFDFNPDDKAAVTADYGAAISLQNYILNKLQGVTTVAFVHAKTTGHTVLPVLACREIVMSEDAELGAILSEGEPPFGEADSKRLIYQETVKAHNRDKWWGVVRKMFDPNVVLRKGPGAVYFDLRKQKEEGIPGDPAVYKEQVLPWAPDGQLGLFKGRELREIGFVKATAKDRNELAAKYNLSPASLRTDPLGGRTPDVYKWEIREDITPSLREKLGRVLRDVRNRGGNVLILIINSGGEDLDAARGLADDLRAAQEGEDAIKIVAFIPDSAPGAGTVVALGCNEIVMTKTKPDDIGEFEEAEIGDFSAYLQNARQSDAEAQRKSIRELAEAQGYPGILIDGMFNPEIEILRVSRQASANRKQLITREQYDLDNAEEKKKGQDANPWTQPQVIKPKGELLKLPATLAADLGVARAVVEGKDANAVTTEYGWPEAKDPEPGWLDKFAEFLKLPAVTVLLVVIGFTGLILELKVPGLTVPGIIAALCFILVFWAHSKFSGQTIWLALLLFLLGLVLLGLEIFVIPGFGAAGICGIFAMIAGLALVTFEEVPQTGGEWGDLGFKASQYLVALLGSIVLAIIIARYLPKLPGGNRLVLNAPVESVGVENLPGASEAAELLGAIGTTNTPLRPAGVVKFGEKFVDVVSDGGFIAAGTRVQVIQVEGTRIVVKEV